MIFDLGQWSYIAGHITAFIELIINTDVTVLPRTLPDKVA